MTEQPQLKYPIQEDNPEAHPLKAINKYKQMQFRVQTMKNRFKVLQGQQQYSRYKLTDHTKKLTLHQSLHQKIQQQKTQLKKSMQKITDITKSLRQKCKQQRQQTKKRLLLAKSKLIQQKRSRSQLINQQFLLNQKRLKQIKNKEQQENRLKRQKIMKEQQKMKQHCKKYLDNKLKGIRSKKIKQGSNLNNQSHSLSKEIQMMMEYQKKLMDQYSQSQEITNDLRQQYNNQIFLMNNTKKSQIQILPEINNKTINYSTIHQNS